MIGAPGRASPIDPARGGGRHHVLGLLGAVGAVALLGAAGRRSLATPPLTSLDDARAWLDTHGGVDAGFAVVRVLAMLGAAYLVVALMLVLALEIVAQRSARRSVLRILELVTFAALRRLLTGVAGASFATAVALPGGALRSAVAPDDGPASASGAVATGERMVLVDPDGPDADGGGDAGNAQSGRGPDAAGTAAGTTAGTATMRWLAPDDEPAIDQGRADAPPAPEPGAVHVAPAPVAAPVAGTWALAPGEHLWYVAESHLADSWGRPVTDSEITSYWLALVERNRPALPDPANPDLVYPGFVVELPPVPAPPRADR